MMVRVINVSGPWYLLIRGYELRLGRISGVLSIARVGNTVSWNAITDLIYVLGDDTLDVAFVVAALWSKSNVLLLSWQHFRRLQIIVASTFLLLFLFVRV